MTLTLKSRDLVLGLALLAVGVVIGLGFRAMPSQAQSVPASSGYVQNGNVMYYCHQRDCYPVTFRQF